LANWKILTITLNCAKIKNSFTYIILWAAGFVVATSVLFLWNKGEKFENVSIFNNLEGASPSKKISNNIVDELLLSANEFNIYGKSTLIEYNRQDNTLSNDLLIQQIKINPGNAYQTILKNKLQKLKEPQTPASDFNIKPVPK
jgi:hypothetical protein